MNKPRYKVGEKIVVPHQDKPVVIDEISEKNGHVTYGFMTEAPEYIVNKAAWGGEWCYESDVIGRAK
jgi:hypothetical protein